MDCSDTDVGQVSMELCHDKLLIPFYHCDGQNQVCMLGFVKAVHDTNLPQKLMLCIENLASFSVKDSSTTGASKTTD